MNTQLTQHFLGLSPKEEMMSEVSYYDIIPALDKHFDHKWAWEVTDERLIMDNSMVSTTVAVYAPGRVLTGRAVAKIKDYGFNHLHALVDACSIITLKKVQIKDEQTGTVSSQQMSAEQIMAMAGGQNPGTAPINSIPQADNYRNEQNIVDDDLPFFMSSDEVLNQMAPAPNNVAAPPVPQNNNTLTPQAPQQPQTQAPNNTYGSAYMQPNPALNGYSQCQVDRMNKVKQMLDIVNDNMLGNWVNTWNSSFTSKKDLTPMNIDAFLSWAEDFAKNM